MGSDWHNVIIYSFWSCFLHISKPNFFLWILLCINIYSIFKVLWDKEKKTFQIIFHDKKYSGTLHWKTLIFLLSVYFRDSCWYAPVALKQSLKFIPVGLVSTLSLNVMNIECQTNVNHSVSPLTRFSFSLGPGSTEPENYNRGEDLSFEKYRYYPLTWQVIGPGSSANTIQVSYYFHFKILETSIKTLLIPDKRRLNK